MIEDIKKKFFSISSLEEAISLKKQCSIDYINPLKDKLSKASPEDKKNIGIEINRIKGAIETEWNKARDKFKKQKLKIETKDYSIANYQLSDYSFNSVEKIKEELIEFFNSLNFVIDSGSEIVDADDNFETLCVPKNHPSRSPSETFYVEKSRILRPHCTVSSVDYLKKLDKSSGENRVAILGAVYRNDDEDTRHTHQFHQADFLWVSKKMTFSNLKYFLILLFKHIFGDDQDYRFRFSYFPFTNLSVEMDLKCCCLGSKMCRICKGAGWIEVLGAGMLLPQILKKIGYPEGYECIAGGIGIERIAMVKFGIEDARLFYDNNFDFLKDKW